LDRGREGPTIDIDSEEFLELVWGERKGWVDVPAKLNGNWISYHTLWDGNGCATSISRRIDASLRDGEDLYFSVGMFSKRGRHDEDFMASEWLWADLDLVHPSEASKLGLTPTIAWVSSGGRYQALWRMDRRLGSAAHDRLNQALSYRIGADRGGWDLTQVLRIPGTRNFKYEDAPLVSLLWYDPDIHYDPRKLWAKVRGSVPAGADVGGQTGSLPRRPMPARARALLRVPSDAVVEGERSARLWELECLLVEAGWGEDDIYEVVAESAWNKWANVGTGESRLRRDIRKAIRYVYQKVEGTVGLDNDGATGAGEEEDQQPGVPSDDGLPFTRYATFMATEMEETPRWLIEGIWTEGAHGIIGGEPKTLKTTLALAMGISVASGKDFLGQFPVHAAGPVLMVQEENAPWNMRDRMQKIAYYYGLISRADVTFSPSPTGSIGSTVASVRFPDDLPIHILNNYGFDLEVEEHRERLEQKIQEVRPKMLILDPLYLMFGVADLDRVHEIRPYLKWLMQVRYEYDCAIVLVHHMRKAGASRPGQRMLGSTAFHGWVASGLYASDIGDADSGWKQISLEREFREQEPQESLKIGLRMGKPGDVREFQSVVSGWNQGDQLLDMVVAAGGKLLQSAAMKELEVGRQAINRRAHGHERLAVMGGGGRGDPRYIVLTDEDGNVPSA
jgi:AAA domain/RepB DNA-primase N-terminal domain